MTAPAERDNRREGAPAESVHLGAALRLLDQPVVAADLAAGAEMAARPLEARTSDAAAILLFRLGDETLAVPARFLRRVTPHSTPAPIPHRTSGVLRGLCNIRGELVLCADLRRLLGLPDRADASTPSDPASDRRRMVVIGPADAAWVFEVDALIGVERVETAAIMSPPLTVEHAIGAFVAGLAHVDGARVTMLDGDRILAGFKAGLA